MTGNSNDSAGEEVFVPDPSWGRKFRNSFCGMVTGIKSESSFHVHLPAAVAVVAAGLYFRVTRTEWSVLAICVTGVLAAELFNRAVEILAKAVDRRENTLLRDALDVSSAAVLMVGLGAVAAGCFIFLPYLLSLFSS